MNIIVVENAVGGNWSGSGGGSFRRDGVFVSDTETIDRVVR